MTCMHPHTWSTTRAASCPPLMRVFNHPFAYAKRRLEEEQRKKFEEEEAAALKEKERRRKEKAGAGTSKLSFFAHVSGWGARWGLAMGTGCAGGVCAGVLGW